MKGMIVINPTSGQQIFQQTVKLALNKLLDEGICEALYIMHTTGKDSAYSAVSKLKQGEYDFVMAVGGDGTMNEIVNGLVVSGSDIPLVIYPAGTSNDFASSLGLPREIGALVKMIKNFRVEQIDVGCINGKYFLNVAAGGMLSDIAHKVSTNAKTVFGRLAYYTTGVKELSSFKFKTVPLKYETENMTVTADTFLMIVANSNSVGGFSKITPHAKLNDGLFDVCLLKTIKPVDMVPVFTQIQTGTHTKDNKCVTYFRTNKIVISTVNENDEFPIDYDGEYCGTPPITIEVIPKAIKLVVPKNGKKINKLLVKDGEV